MRLLHRARGSLVAAVLAAAIAGCATPEPPVPELAPQSVSARGIIVIAHGVEERADRWPLDLERAFRALDAPQHLWDIHRVDWYEASLNRLAAPRVGYALGEAIGRELAGGAYDYEVVHLVGHSAGAHVIRGIADVVRTAPAGSQIAIHATYLDPFVGRSLFRLFWGVRRFGSRADFAESYVTTEDRVPFTNSFLRNAHNFDLTSILPERPGAPDNYAHMYPTVFYRTAARGEGRPAPGLALSPIARLGARVDAESTRRLAGELAGRYPPGAVTVPSVR